MRDKKSRGLCFFQNAAHLQRQTFAQFHVKVREGFVEQQQLRLRCQSTGQSHALLLAARQFVRKTLRATAQTNQRQHFAHTGFALSTGQFV